MMRAVGMERRQLVRMIRAEAMTYAVSGCLAGCAIGIPLHAWFYGAVITDYFGTPWALPVVQLLIIFAVVICSAFAAVRAPAQRISSMAITESANEL